MSKIDKIVSHIPSWLAVSEEKNLYKLLDSFGSELEEVEDLMDELENSLYLSTANVSIPDYIHKMFVEQLQENTITNIVVSANIPTVDSVYKLLTATSMTGMFDYENYTFYINHYDNSTAIRLEVFETRVDADMNVILDSDGEPIKGGLITTYSDKPELHHIWNCFDEFALIVGLTRFDGETNADLRIRITSAITNPPGSDSSGLQVAIARDMGLQASDIQLKTFDDIEVYDKNDNLSSEFLNYVRMLKNIKPLTIAKWDAEIIDDAIYSVHYVPRIYNNILEQIPDEYIQSGIGDQGDLMVYPPTEENAEQEYSCYIGLTADRESKSVYYPRHEFKLLMDANGIKMDKMHKPKDINFTVMAAENKDVVFTIEAVQDYILKLTKDFTGLGSMQSAAQPVTTGTPSKSDSVQIVPSNTLFHVKDRYLRVKVKLQSNDTKTLAPTVKLMKISYRRSDNSTGQFTVPLDTPEDNVDNNGVDGSNNPILTIQKGEYYKVFETPASFTMNGTVDGLIVDNRPGIHLPSTL